MMKNTKKNIRKSIRKNTKLSFLLPLVLLFTGCNSGDSIPEVKPKAAKEVVEVDDGRIYITEHNYVKYEDNNGRPRHYIFKAKEWPREDINDASSYDLPRIVFRWNNQKSPDGSNAEYESRDKIWSIKTDGTDLRLVADDFQGYVRYMRRSPDNRYLTYAYSGIEGTHKALFDLKTGETKVLATYPGLPIFLWAEDSSYFYYANGRNYYKYDIASGKDEVVDIRMSQNSVIYDGKRFVVNAKGISVIDESSNNSLYFIVPEKGVDMQLSKFHKKSISPTGRYVWATTRDKKFFIDTKTKKVLRMSLDDKRYMRMEMIGLGAYYGTTGAAGRAVEKRDEKGNRTFIVRWGIVGTGQTASAPSLYNAFVNDGALLKVDI